MALVLRNTLSYGRRVALITSLGICSGLLVHASLAGLGLSAILARSAELYEAVRLVGGVYLVVLGLQTFWRMRGEARDTSVAVASIAPTARPARPPLRAYAEGVLSNVLNPKVALFYLTFLPQFIRPDGPLLPQAVLLAGIHISMGVVWLVLYVYLIDRLTSLLTRADIRRRIEGATAVVLIALGLRLAWERR